MNLDQVPHGRCEHALRVLHTVSLVDDHRGVLRSVKRVVLVRVDHLFVGEDAEVRLAPRDLFQDNIVHLVALVGTTLVNDETARRVHHVGKPLLHLHLPVMNHGFGDLVFNFVVVEEFRDLCMNMQCGTKS